MRPFDGPTRALLHDLRWRRSPRDKPRLWLALGLTFALHVFFVIGAWYEMKPRVQLVQVVPPPPERAIQIRFITRHVSTAPIPPPAVIWPTKPVHEPISKQALTVHLPKSAPTAVSTPAPAPATSIAAKLFDHSGNIILPANASSSAAPTDYVQHAPEGDTQIMQHRAGAVYQSAPNKFQKYFPPPKESLVGGVMRKLNGHESNTQSVDLPKGIHLKCQKVFGIPIPNCGIPPDPPPPNDGDMRMNMAPAPLVKDAPTPKAPDLATCIAEYKANKPLPYGCPVDTPARSVSEDAQQQQH